MMISKPFRAQQRNSHSSLCWWWSPRWVALVLLVSIVPLAVAQVGGLRGFSPESPSPAFLYPPGRPSLPRVRSRGSMESARRAFHRDESSESLMDVVTTSSNAGKEPSGIPIPTSSSFSTLSREDTPAAGDNAGVTTTTTAMELSHSRRHHSEPNLLSMDVPSSSAAAAAAAAAALTPDTWLSRFPLRPTHIGRSEAMRYPTTLPTEPVPMFKLDEDPEDFLEEDDETINDDDDVDAQQVDRGAVEEPTPAHAPTATDTIDLVCEDEECTVAHMPMANEFEQLKQLIRQAIEHMLRMQSDSQMSMRVAADDFNAIAQMRPSLSILMRAFNEVSKEFSWDRLVLVKEMLASFITYRNALEALTVKSAFVGLDLWHIHLMVPTIPVYIASLAVANRMARDLMSLVAHGSHRSVVRFMAKQVFRISQDDVIENSLNVGLLSSLRSDDARKRMTMLEMFSSAASGVQDAVASRSYDMVVDLMSGAGGMFSVLDRLEPKLEPVRNFVQKNKVPISIALSSATLVLQLLEVASDSAQGREYTVGVQISVRAVEILDELKKENIIE